MKRISNACPQCGSRTVLISYRSAEVEACLKCDWKNYIWMGGSHEEKD